jgi:hypothetical protein
MLLLALLTVAQTQADSLAELPPYRTYALVEEVTPPMTWFRIDAD